MSFSRAAALAAAVAVLAAAPAARATLALRPAPASPYRVGAVDETLAAADLNLDGRADLAFAGGTSVGAMLASAVGDLSPVSGSPFQTGPGTRWVQLGDLNGDGLPDLVSAGEEASVLLATAGGGFAPAPGGPPALGAGAAASAVAIADLDGDGHPDLAFADCGTTCGGSGVARVSLLLGDGHGGFAPAPDSPFLTGQSETSAIVATDLNGDGAPDLVVGGRGTVSVLLGDGRGGLSPAAGSPVATGSTRTASDVAVGDVNGDGHPDVVTANSSDATVSVLLGDGRGRLAAAGLPLATGSSGSAQGISLADLNADGTLDAIVANERSSPSTGDVSLLLGDGHGGFAPAPSSPLATGGEASFVQVGDFDGDGQPDVASAGGHDRNISVLLNEAQAAAAPSASLLAYRPYFLGESSQPETLTVTNTGTGFLRLGAARFAGAHGADFQLGEDRCSGAVLLVGRSCSLGVVFRPRAGGLREGSLELPSNAPGAPIEVALSGTGIGLPQLTSVSLSPSRFAVRRPGRNYSALGRPHGARLTLTLSEQATVRLAFTRLARGHRRRHACRAKGRGPRCTLEVRLGNLDYRLPAGTNSIAIAGMLHGRPLRAGSYVLSAIAVNAQGQSSTGVRLRFRIVR